MIYPKVPSLSPPLDEARRSCHLCGAFHKEVEIRFYGGNTAPVVGETLTGAVSTDTGVVNEVVLESGSYSGGNAAGTICLTSPTGVDEQGLWGTVDEVLNGSVGGASIMTLTDEGSQKSYGRLWPESQLIFREGRYFCREHYNFHFDSKDRLTTPFSVEDR